VLSIRKACAPPPLVGHGPTTSPGDKNILRNIMNVEMNLFRSQHAIFFLSLSH
jgi:hypothetical protein